MMLCRLLPEMIFFFKTVSTFEMGQDSLYRLPGVRETLHSSYTEQNCYFSIIVCVVANEPI